VKWSDCIGKSANGSSTTTTTTVVDMTATNMATAMTVMITTNDLTRSLRQAVARLLVAGSLLLTPYIAAPAEDQPHEAAISTQARSFGAAVKHDAKVVGDNCKKIAHQVGVAAKSVGHEIATAAKRGTAETRAAFGAEKDEKEKKPAS
jgi:hypothetical protein